MRSFLFLLLTICVPAIYASEKSLLVATYNVENLFDTVNHPFIQDDILSAEQYQLKVKNIARVIGELEPDLLVLCEVENAEVVEDVVREVGTPAYRVVHYDSPDPRGMDVAMIYRPDRLQVLNSEPIAAPDGYRTRDVLPKWYCWTERIFTPISTLTC